VVGAHYDHLGIEGENTYWGADDNAAAVGRFDPPIRCSFRDMQRVNTKIQQLIDTAGEYGARLRSSPLQAIQAFDRRDGRNASHEAVYGIGADDADTVVQ